MVNKYNYQFTDLALADLENVLSYISNTLMNKKAARDLLALLDNTIERICDFPYSYPYCSYYFIEDSVIRHATIKNYVLVYRVNEETSTIEILRFKYSKQSNLL